VGNSGGNLQLIRSTPLVGGWVGGAWLVVIRGSAF
jgi:hypothetical protein